ncbi:MAG: helix-turn-helix transcriptional regulator [Clostridia bacterium]|nr:helix-turn-helix transcriptional regulator [Clostridia bacterium]
MDIKFEKKVGENIRRLRKEKKFTQEQVAAKLQVRGCDITRSALAKIEAGQRHLYPDEIKALKEILNVPYDAFFAE